jgi:polygalacturonase
MVRSLVAALLAGASVLNAQDTRTVTEPKIPASCAVLTARLAPVADTTLAESDERSLDTKHIQSAIDACAPGRAVVLKASGAKRAFLTGPLTLKRGVTLVVDTNAILFASRDPNEYDMDGRCGTVDAKGHGCRPLISSENAPGVGIMGAGIIDGRGWAKLLGKDVSWWDLAQDAKVKNQNQSCPRLIQLTKSDNATLYGITLRNSPNFHVVFDRGNGFTVWGIRIDTRDPRARNTDGIDPMSATNVTITHSFINTGDDNVAVKAGNKPSSHITVSHNHFYRGHGVSIGSETDGGASAIRVFDLSIQGADNGLRIKSNAARGGLVHDVEYRDICIRDTKNPIEMDTHYTASAKTTGDMIPEFRDIRLKDVRVSGAGKVTLEGYDNARPLAMAWDNVMFDDVAKIKVSAGHVRIARGPGPTNLNVTGEDVQMSGATSEAPVNSCVGKFLVMPVVGSVTQTEGKYVAVVDASFRGTDGDSTRGTPTFRTLGAALTALPPNGVGRTRILVKNGRYHEKLTIDRPYITLMGESRDSTIITYDAAADTPSPGGGTYGTRGSFTLRVVAPDFRAENLTIENAFDYPRNVAKPDSDKTKFKNMQGVALMLDLGSDRATFDRVKLTGYQDTFFANAGRAFFGRCEIQGNVDFIFGAGQVVFDSCDIVSRDRGSKTTNGYVTAASTDTSQKFGFLFINSRLKKDRPTMAPNSVTLGRPWHPFANPRANASVAFINCWMDDHIGDKGWDRMSSVDSTGNRIWYEPSSARFVEYGSTGPGAVKSATRPMLTPEQAKRYTIGAVLGDWHPVVVAQ